jgi:hypothetical protein
MKKSFNPKHKHKVPHPDSGADQNAPLVNGVRDDGISKRYSENNVDAESPQLKHKANY